MCIIKIRILTRDQNILCLSSSQMSLSSKGFGLCKFESCCRYSIRHLRRHTHLFEVLKKIEWLCDRTDTPERYFLNVSDNALENDVLGGGGKNQKIYRGQLKCLRFFASHAKATLKIALMCSEALGHATRAFDVKSLFSFALNLALLILFNEKESH